MIFRILIIFLLIISTHSCLKKDKAIYEPQKKINAYEIYRQGLEAFEKNDFFFASKKFSQAEVNFVKIEYAAKSAIMSS